MFEDASSQATSVAKRTGRGDRRRRNRVDDDQSDTAPDTVALANPVIAVSDGDGTPPGADVAESAGSKPPCDGGPDGLAVMLEESLDEDMGQRPSGTLDDYLVRVPVGSQDTRLQSRPLEATSVPVSEMEGVGVSSVPPWWQGAVKEYEYNDLDRPMITLAFDPICDSSSNSSFCTHSVGTCSGEEDSGAKSESDLDLECLLQAVNLPLSPCSEHEMPVSGGMVTPQRLDEMQVSGGVVTPHRLDFSPCVSPTKSGASAHSPTNAEVADDDDDSLFGAAFERDDGEDTEGFWGSCAATRVSWDVLFDTVPAGPDLQCRTMLYSLLKRLTNQEIDHMREVITSYSNVLSDGTFTTGSACSCSGSDFLYQCLLFDALQLPPPSCRYSCDCVPGRQQWLDLVVHPTATRGTADGASMRPCVFKDFSDMRASTACCVCHHPKDSEVHCPIPYVLLFSCGTSCLNLSGSLVACQSTSVHRCLF